MLQFLLLEDNAIDAQLIQQVLLRSNLEHEVVWVTTRAEFLAAFTASAIDLILADYNLPEFNGIEALAFATEHHPEIPFIIVSGSLGEELAIDTLKRGATDYVLKQRLERLVPAVNRALREAQERRERKRAEQMLIEQKHLLEMIALGRPLDECLAAVCTAVSRLNSVRACFLLTDAQRQTFPYAITPNFPSSLGQGLKDAPIGDLCIGTCGEAVYRGRPITCANVANDDRWSQAWRDLCIAHDILACHSQPVIGIDGMPLGSLMLCLNEVRIPTAWEYQLAEFGTQVASIAFERDRSSLALRTREAQLQILLDTSPLGVYLVDQNFCIRQMNPVALPVFGNIHDLIGRDFDEVIHLLWSQAYADDVVERFRHTLETGEPYFVPEHIEERRDRGGTEYYEWQINRIPLPDDSYGVVCFFRDISAQVLTRQAIAESEERLSSFVEANVVGILFGDVHGGIHKANDELLKIIGYTREDLQTDKIRWTDITPPEYLPLDEQHIAEAKARGACTPYEKEYIRKDGCRVPVLVGYSLVGDAREESVAFILDLSDRKQTEADLRQSEARFRLMVEGAKEYAIFTLDLNGRVTSWNSGAERLLGYQESEIIGRDGRILYTPEDNQQGRADREMQTAQTQGRAVNECWHVRQDGSRFWGSGLVMPLQTETGTLQGFVKVMQDKTAQRQADERFQLLYDTTSDLLATNQPLTLMHNLFDKLAIQLELDFYYNYMLEEKDSQPKLHLRNHQGISNEVAQTIEWIDCGQHLCGLVAQQQRQIVLDQTQIFSHPNAQLVCSSGITAYAGQPLIVQGRLLGTLSFASCTRTYFTSEEINLLQSVCDQMAIALERSNLMSSIQQQAEQLQRANQVKDEFLAVLSHELRSPLNPILGWTRLLQNGNLNEARRAEALKTIERNAKLQSQLIEDLLDISRIMQGKLSLTAAPVSLTFVIAAALETVRLAAEAKAIDFKFTILDSELAEDDHPKSKIVRLRSRQISSTELLTNVQNPKFMVSGDAVRLQQVIWNLLTNAVKFTPSGGQVTVELRQLNHLAQIRVIDTGKGINAQFLPHVFDYFRQEDGSTTRKFGGLGLGLAIVRQLVETHGGTVWAESQGENQGATFVVQLPIMPPVTPIASEPTLTPTGTAAPLDNIQILLVDDELDTREFQAFLLEQSGAKVTAVASGLAALQALEQSMPQVIVSDIGMAEMDGYMLMQQIRSRPAAQGGTIPAIALTAYAAEDDQRKALAAGFQAHITKPVEPEMLVKAIANLCPRNSF